MTTQALRFLGPSLMGLLLVFTTSTTRAQLSLASGDDAEISEDGLHRVDRSLIIGGFAKPGLDLSGYTRLYFQPTVIAFRPVDSGQPNQFSSKTGELYAVSEVRQGQLRELFGESMHGAIADLENFELTDQVGRDVLLVRGSLLDFISAVPPDYSGSRTGGIRWAYEATLLIELRDSMSDEILARTIERQRGDGPIDINEVTILTPRLFNSWTNRLARNVGLFGELAR